MRFRILMALALVGAPAVASAQPGLIIDQQRADRAPPQAKPVAPAAQAPPPAASLDLQTPSSALLRRVVVSGSSLPPAAFDRATAPLVGKPMDLKTIQAVAQAASKAYAKSRIALHTVLVPQQDLADGVLRLQVIEGSIAQVVLQGGTKGRDLKLVTAQAGKLTDERPLSRARLERQLSLIRDIPGLTSEARLLPGKAPGTTVLVLDLKPKGPELNLTLNNRGSSLLGRTQLQADLYLYSSFRQGDQTKLSVSLPTDIERFQYYALVHSQPIGVDGLRAQVQAGYFRTRPENPPSRGEAGFGGVQLSYPAIRGYQRNLFLTGALDGLNSSNAVFGRGTATERTRALRLAAAWSQSKPQSQVSASATASQGIDGLGARTTAGIADANFRKLNLRAGYDHALGQRWAVRLRAAGQLTSDLTPSSEQFSAGGQEFGRAFEQALVIGDTGGAGSVELAVRPAGLPKLLAGSEAYGFADAATVTQSGRLGGPDQTFDLASAGAGVRMAFGPKTSVGLEGAYGLNDPRPGRDGTWRLGVNLAVRR